MLLLTNTVVLSRLSMDNTTMATKYSSFLKCTDLSLLSINDPGTYRNVAPHPGNEKDLQAQCGNVVRQVNRMKKRGCFNKPWIFIPINLGDLHWVIVGLLNCTYLGTPQEKAFSGYFIYDSIDRDCNDMKAMTILHNRGILNLVIYANLVFGNPRITGQDIYAMVNDVNKFTPIKVLPEDHIRQSDTWNCGVFVWMTMLEMSLVHAKNYTKAGDFVSKHGDQSVYLQKGDWFKLYKDEAYPEKYKNHALPHQIYDTIRHLACVLFARMQTLKTGKNVSPRQPQPTLPNYMRKNFRRFVWNIDDNKQAAIDNWMNWAKGDPAELSKLLKCDNDVIRHGQDIFEVDEEDEDDDDDAETTKPNYTFQELERAGIRVEMVEFEDDRKPAAIPQPGPGQLDDDEQAADDQKPAAVSRKGKRKADELDPPPEEVPPVASKPGNEEDDTTESEEEKSNVDADDKPSPNKNWKAASLNLKQSDKNESKKVEGNKHKAWKKPRRHDKKSPRQSKPVPVPSPQRVKTELEIRQQYGSRKAGYYPKSRQDIALATKAVSRIARLPNTQADFEKWKVKVTSGQRRANELLSHQRVRVNEAYTKWQDFQEFKGQEAELFLHDSVKALQYNVVLDEPWRKGYFNVTLRESDEIVEVDREWVMQNFEKDVVDSVVNECLGTFVEVDNVVNVFVDRRQIKKLRLYTPKDVETRTTPPPYFEGLLSDGTVTRLTKRFVKDNFPQEFVNQVNAMGKKYKDKFFHVPPGAPRTVEGHWILDLNNPRLEYMQKGMDTCLFSSLASALHYLGLEESAAVIAARAQQYAASSPNGIVNWEGLLQVMNKTCRWLVPRKLHGKNFQILTDISDYPTTVSLQAVDGGTQHAVTVVGKFIFDSNCERALPLTEESLNHCCSTDTTKGAYMRVYRGYRFEEAKNAKWKRSMFLKNENEENDEDDMSIDE